MENIKIKSLGPIVEAEINFGDLTLFVGPQASGKSILLQLIKLLVDKNHIRKTIEQYGFVWGSQEEDVLNRYFGEGMSSIWDKDTNIHLDGKLCSRARLISKKNEKVPDGEEALFYIPAQRVVCLQNGWPRFFTDYEDSVPYVLRQFSETLRQMLENNMSKKENTVFPASKRPLRNSFNESIFHDGKVVLDTSGKKRFKLNLGNSSIPYMAWSAGQKEFMPLLLSFYWLCPNSTSERKDNIKIVVIEEPEMGLHPQAIQSVIVQIIELLSRGYKVIVSTHSPVLLEFAWAFQFLAKANASDDSFFELFDLKKSASLSRLFKGILKNKKINTYAFNRNKDGVVVRDISSLDAGSEDDAVSEWGGLSSFSSKASDIISKIVANEE